MNEIHNVYAQAGTTSECHVSARDISTDTINLSNVRFTCPGPGRPDCPPAYTKSHEIKRDHASESLLRIIACYTSVEIKHDRGLGTVELGGPEHCFSFGSGCPGDLNFRLLEGGV